MRKLSKGKVALVIGSILLILVFAVRITMNLEPAPSQSRVEQVTTAVAVIKTANQPVTVTQQPVATETAWVMPTDVPHFHCDNNITIELVTKTFEIDYYVSHGSGPYPDCNEPGFASFYVYYMQGIVHYKFYMNQSGLMEVSIRNR